MIIYKINISLRFTAGKLPPIIGIHLLPVEDGSLMPEG